MRSQYQRYNLDIGGGVKPLFARLPFSSSFLLSSAMHTHAVRRVRVRSLSLMGRGMQ